MVDSGSDQYSRWSSDTNSPPQVSCVPTVLSFVVFSSHREIVVDLELVGVFLPEHLEISNIGIPSTSRILVTGVPNVLYTEVTLFFLCAGAEINHA